MGKVPEKQETKFSIEKISKETRKIILVTIIIIIMSPIFLFWIYSFKNKIREENDYFFQKSEWEEMSGNLSSMVQEARGEIDEVKERLEEIVIFREGETENTTDINLDEVKRKIIFKKTEDWEIYENKDYNFEIKYPNYLELKKSEYPAIMVLADKYEQEDDKFIEIKKYGSLIEMEEDNKLKKYLQLQDYFLAAISYKASTTADLIIETFKFFE